MAVRIRFAAPIRLPRLLGFGDLLAWNRAAADRSRQRRRLAEMSDQMLKDIGITREQAQAASETSWWLAVRGG